NSSRALPIWWCEEHYHAMGDLLYSVKNGRPSFDHVYKMGAFEYLAQDPEAAFNEKTMPTDEMQIRRLRDDWIEAVKGKKVDRLIELVTDDVVVIHPNGRTTTGKEQLRTDLVASFVRMTICNQTIEWDELMVSGDLAVERARIKTTVLPTGGEAFHV